MLRLLYDGKKRTIWERVSSILKFDLSLKIIVFGLYTKISDKTTLNNLIAFITFSMHKFKMEYRLKDDTM